MFKFNVVDNAKNQSYNFFNGDKELGVKDTYRFLSWLDLTGLNLNITQIHQLLKYGVSGVVSLEISECELFSDLIV